MHCGEWMNYKGDNGEQWRAGEALEMARKKNVNRSI
jgi:hypothetical protein